MSFVAVRFLQIEATIEDVLRFRRALAFMDEIYQFGVGFGNVSNKIS